MKKKLLYFTSIMLFLVTTINAQTTIWDMGNNKTILNDGTEVIGDWPIRDVFAAETMIKSLGIFPGPNSFGATSAQAASGFTDSYTAVNRFTSGGASAAFATGAPTSRYLYFNVSGACTIKVWFKGGNSTSTRSLLISNGTLPVLGSGASVNGAALIVEAAVTTAGKYYVYCDNGINIYKIEVVGATVNTPALSTDSFQKVSQVNVYAKDNKIFLSNVKSKTAVSVYTVAGALVKFLETAEDTSIDVKAGVYVVKASSAEGTKSVKVIVQ